MEEEEYTQAPGKEEAIMLDEISQSISELEQAGADAAGVPLSLLRFATAFLLSVPVGIVFKYVTTVTGRLSYCDPNSVGFAVESASTRCTEDQGMRHVQFR